MNEHIVYAGVLLAAWSALCIPSLAPAAEAPPPGKLTSAAEEKRLQGRYANYREVDPGYRHAGEAALDRWMDWKWGLRIHWGLYCMFDGQESWIINDHIKDKEWQRNYYVSYQQFNPTGFDADEWMQVMKRAGMKYFSFTSKHHEGFCMWPTKTLQKGFRKTDDGRYEDVMDHYSIAETPYKKDIVGALIKAGRAHGLGVSLYYSHIDWHDWDFGWDNRNFSYDPKLTKESDPKRWAAFIQKERDQITELLTSYGPLDTLCLDGGWPSAAQKDANEVAKLTRALQPNIMLRNRGIGDYGDYETPEATIPENPNDIKRPWQVIYPCGTGFSYKKHDTYKSKEWVLESLIDICSKGGNFQVGFGPDPNGKWPQEMIERVSYVGDWLKVNGEAIFATRPYVRYREGRDLRFTRTKDKKYLYVISLQWPGETLATKLVRAKPGTAIRMLGVDQDLKWTQNQEQGLIIRIPAALAEKKPCAQAYAFKIEAEWPADDAPFLRASVVPSVQPGPPGRQVKVATIPIGFGGNRDQKVKLAIEHLETAGQNNVDIACLPEEFAGTEAEAIPGPTTKAIAEQAKKHRMYVVCPVREQAADGRQYNTAVLLDRQGDIAGYYRKVFVFWGEGLNLSEESVKVFDTDFGRLAILTCFDANFDEVWQEAARKGAELVLWPSAYGGGRVLNGYAMIHNYYIAAVGQGNMIDMFGNTIENVEKPRPQQFIATLDLDLTIVHTDFTGDKIAKLLQEHQGEIERVPGIGGMEGWYVLRATKPGVRARDLCKQYQIETLREYRLRSREQINERREKGEKV
jgi:alpha-L-fucosidase